MTASGRLPGILVEPVPSPPGIGLPSMDVAAFAGFAERGPCNRAVLVDGVAAYEACFGGEAVLARAADGSWSRAGLPATVRAFFANGGHRCWVVRLARTPSTELAWAAAAGRAEDFRDVAAGNLFPLPGVLWRVPGPGGGPSRVRAARLQAASLGSWSDSLRLAARLNARAVPVGSPVALPGGFQFTDPGGLAAGSMIELVSRAGAVRRFAKILRREGGDWLALWSASFQRTTVSRDLDGETGRARVAGFDRVFEAILHEGPDTRIEFPAGTPQGLSAGQWLRFVAQGEAVWMLVERVTVGAVHGAAWQQVASRLPTGEFWARAISIDISASLGSDWQVFTAIDPGDGGLGLLDDDDHYAASVSRAAVARAPFCLSAVDRAALTQAFASAGSGADSASLAALYGTAGFTAAARRALRSAWLPLGLGADFGPAQGAFATNRPALARDGLSRFDADLFLDPVLGGVDTPGMAAALERRRDLEEAALSGIHALADTPGHPSEAPSILAVPDIAQPGWTLAPAAGLPGAASPGAILRHTWLTHSGGCVDADDEAPAERRFDRFLDCAVRQLATPGLRRVSGKQGAGDFVLGFSSGESGATFIVEESGDPGFARAAEIYRGTDPDLAVTGRTPGAYYYRLRIEIGGNSSDWASLAIRVGTGDYLAGVPDTALLQRLHVATLRLAAGTADMVALLGLPASWRTADAISLATGLRRLAPGYGGPDQLGAHEARALSYGALFHPWLVYRADREVALTDSELVAVPPLGCVAGAMAATARLRGAWIAQSGTALNDVIGLAPSLPETDQPGLYRERVNMVRRSPAGFVVPDNDTLSTESEWKEITVRRLMILLRRIALEQGNTYVFEPHGPVLRRAVENGFNRLLDNLQRRGVFAGRTSRQSFNLQVDARPGAAELGRFAVEIGVATSVPMRFLTVRLLQQGGRLTLAEEAA